MHVPLTNYPTLASIPEIPKLKHMPIIEKHQFIRSKLENYKANINYMFSIFIVLYLAICGTVRFNGPTGFVAKSLENFVVVTVLWELVVPIHSQTGEDLRRDCSSSSFSPLVVLPFFPRRLPRPWRHRRKIALKSPEKTKFREQRKQRKKKQLIAEKGSDYSVIIKHNHFEIDRFLIHDSDSELKREKLVRIIERSDSKRRRFSELRIGGKRRRIRRWRSWIRVDEVWWFGVVFRSERI